MGGGGERDSIYERVKRESVGEGSERVEDGDRGGIGPHSYYLSEAKVLSGGGESEAIGRAG